MCSVIHKCENVDSELMVFHSLLFIHTQTGTAAKPCSYSKSCIDGCHFQCIWNNRFLFLFLKINRKSNPMTHTVSSTATFVKFEFPEHRK